MRSYTCLLCVLLAVCGGEWAQPSRGAEPEEASLRVLVGDRQSFRIPRNLTGKFCEHLGANIYNGMDAQILRNPTFADYPFATSEGTPDGLSTFQFEHEKINAELRRQALRNGWPEAELPDLTKARQDGLACFWSRYGATDSVRVSPDTAPGGQRAQRVEIGPGEGIKQWTWLPLHRQRSYELEILARSPSLNRVRVSLLRDGAQQPCAEAKATGLSPEWRKVSGVLTVPSGEPADAAYCVALSTEEAGQIVIAHLFLRPSDHINGADPDVVHLLRAAHLPLLRWPGGNFVSAYHWQDGTGPVDRRPTLPNYAWGGIEPNTFGTDEFIDFCKAVGCEPMICINAGTGTPDEAARWIEYCNAPSSTGMGALRAANGHMEPFHIKHWEVGNELWGRWQARWTTAAGYVDRYKQFAPAMLKADPTIELHACGAPVLWGKAWNDTLITGLGQQLRSITDHPLIGGDVSPQDEPLAIYREFMHVPDVLSSRWEELSRAMTAGGVSEPRLAVTELQMFAHLRGSQQRQGPALLTPETLVTPATLAEALYDTLIYHTAARLQPFVELVTHSATVNHGGGLRKEHERVFPNPCYYANLLFAEFADATPVKIELQSPHEQAAAVLPDLKRAGSGGGPFDAIDALAAVTPNGRLLVSLVHRGSGSPIRVAIKAEGFAASNTCTVSTLSAEHPWDANTLERPNLIEVHRSEAQLSNGSLSVTLPPFSMAQVALGAAR